MDTLNPTDPEAVVGPEEEPRRTLSTSNAVVAVVVGWALAVAAGLLLAAWTARWPGSRVGFIVVSAAGLGAILWCRYRSRVRRPARWTGPTVWTVPIGRTLTRQRERAARLADAVRSGSVEAADRGAVAVLVGERLAAAATSMLTVTMFVVVSVTNLATAVETLVKTVLMGLVLAGMVIMVTSTVTVLRWRRLAHRAGLR